MCMVICNSCSGYVGERLTVVINAKQNEEEIQKKKKTYYGK